jgi:hypothetical protein
MTHVKEIVDLEGHHLTTIIIMELSRKHQWILKPMGKGLMKRECLHGPNVLLNYLLIERKNSSADRKS